MKQATVYVRNHKAGVLTEDADGYTFQYDMDFLHSVHAEAVSLTLPLREEPFQAKELFPFFDGLIPEGWLLDIAERNWKINARDRMSLLLACCKDCIGAVGVEPLPTVTE
ncbi:MAG TPA: HipA N-terminal domain-containing protein [Candidatus Bacteroides merdigallinarum]|uniref:HipA N-terminal domain-containing protein n=1 Tax=Candidatus Bacteroides merdigallinarum TaxID=2838473 RepID=A0A9D2J2R3_9BACE|nr:HipA N-terminal domain-containing protein [Candidatus Bacteroides merdigallinarum]